SREIVGDLRKGYFATTFRSSSLTCPPRSRSLGIAASLGGWRVSPRQIDGQTRKARRLASPADRELRASRQSQDRESARPRNTANIARCRGRGDRMKRREFNGQNANGYSACGHERLSSHDAESRG